MVSKAQFVYGSAAEFVADSLGDYDAFTAIGTICAMYTGLKDRGYADAFLEVFESDEFESRDETILALLLMYEYAS